MVHALVDVLRDKASSCWWIDNQSLRVGLLLGDLLRKTHGEQDDPAQWWRSMLTRNTVMTPHETLMTWCDILAIFDYVLHEPSSDVVSGTLERFRDALSTAPEIAPAAGDLRFLPVVVRGGDTDMIPLMNPVGVARVLGEMAAVTEALPGCDVAEVRNAATSLAVAIKMSRAPKSAAV